MIEVTKLRQIVDKVYDSTENHKKRKEMTRFLKYYKGQYWKEQDDGVFKDPSESEIFANLFFSTVMTIAPLLTDNKPIWSIRAKKPHMQNYIQAYKLAADALWPMLDMDHKIFKWVLDALVMKMGIAKVWFDPDDGELGELAVEIIDPRDFVLAPGYVDVWDAPWCGIVTLKPMSWLKEHYPEYDDKVIPEGDATVKYEEKDGYELCAETVKIYEIWIKDDSTEDYFEDDGQDAEPEELKKSEDKPKKKKKTRKKYPNGRVLTFLKSGDTVLDDKPYPYNHGKPPYVVLYDYMVPHDFVGMGEADQIETLVLEYNLALKKMAKFVHNWADPNFYGVSGSGLEPDEWKRKAPGGGQLFLLNQPGQEPKPALLPQVNPILFDFLSGTSKMIEEITGVTDITKGMVSKKQRQSASEISALVETAYTRTRQRVRNLEWSIKRVFQLIVEIMQQFYSETRTVSMTTEGTNEWFDISNSANYAKEVSKPPMPGEDEEEAPEDARAWELYDKLIEDIGMDESVYADFVIEIQTNSTLPMDQQSLANLFLRLAEVRMGPDSVIDRKSLLDMLHIPNSEEIVNRKKEEAQPQGAPPPGMPPAGAPPGPPQGGM